MLVVCTGFECSGQQIGSYSYTSTCIVVLKCVHMTVHVESKYDMFPRGCLLLLGLCLVFFFLLICRSNCSSIYIRE